MNTSELCELVLANIQQINTFQPLELTSPISIFTFSSIKLSDKYIQRWSLHKHTYNELHFILNGEVDYQFEHGESVTVSKNQWLLLPMEKSHRIMRARGEAVKMTLLFSFESDDCSNMKTLFEHIIQNRLYITGSIDEIHISHIESICSYLREKTTLSPMLCWSTSATLIFSVIQSTYAQHKSSLSSSAYLPDASTDPRFIAAKQFIKDNSMRPVTVSEASEHCHISPKQLNRIFKKESNQTISQYIQEQRIEMIKKQVINDDRPLYLVSQELGFCDELYFSRFFTKMTNMSPSQYREINKEKD